MSLALGALGVYADEKSNDRQPVKERVVTEYGKRAVRTTPDSSYSFPADMRVKKNCFIVVSKKDYYLYVYEAQGADTVLLARYDVCVGRNAGNKQKRGDSRTPHCTLKNPFKISQMQNASTWRHDFGDGRGNILSYGAWFLRLVPPGRGIGIHGSTNNRESVPGRASEGCIRLKDEDIIDLHKHYAHVGMKVVLKAENEGDYSFEAKAMKRRNLPRLRNFNAADKLK
mgnify:CR=1 FL=1